MDLKIPVPDDVAGTTSEGTIPAGHDDLQLHYVRYHPVAGAEAPRLSLVVVHGFAEHIARYRDAFRLFAARGIELIAYDQRGFGKTAEAAKGGFSKHYTNTTWPQQFKDVKAVVTAQRKWLDERYAAERVPIYLMGHSMGGGIVTALFTRDAGSQEAKDLAEVRETVHGVVASSPWYTLTNPTPAPIAFLAPHLLKVFPNLKYPLPLKPEELSADPVVRESWAKDPYIQKWVYAKSALGPSQGGEEIVASKWRNWDTTLPLFVLHGEADQITDSRSSRKVVEQINTLPQQQQQQQQQQAATAKVAEYRGFPEGRHEMMFELGDVKSEYTHAIIDWLHKQAAPKAQAAGSQGIAEPSSNSKL